jgi:biotin carboxyl carrier protein
MNDFTVTVNSEKRNVVLKSDLFVELDGQMYEYELLQRSNYTYLLRFNNRLYTITRVTEGNNPLGILVEGNYFQVSVLTKLEDMAAAIAEKKQKETHRTTAVSPMPGLVLKIKKNIGDFVEFGESVMILEAMKMENDIKSPFSGIIKQIHVSEKQAVEKNAKLFSLE